MSAWAEEPTYCTSLVKKLRGPDVDDLLNSGNLDGVLLGLAHHDALLQSITITPTLALKHIACRSRPRRLGKSKQKALAVRREGDRGRATQCQCQSENSPGNGKPPNSVVNVGKDQV